MTPSQTVRRPSTPTTPSSFTPSPSVFASTAHLVQQGGITSTSPGDPPALANRLEANEDYLNFQRRYHSLEARMPTRRASDTRSSASSATKISRPPMSPGSRRPSKFVEQSFNKSSLFDSPRPSIEITPAESSEPTETYAAVDPGPSRHPRAMQTSPKSLMLPLPPRATSPESQRSAPTSSSVRPKLPKPTSTLLRSARAPLAPIAARSHAARAPSPVPDYIDTGVKGTPPPTRPASRADDASADPSRKSLDIVPLGEDIPRPGTAEEGLVEKGRVRGTEEEDLHAWPPWKRRDGWAGWMNESIVTANLVPSLVIQAFASGILDATTYADFRTFASNQTGNTILLTVSVIGSIEVLLLLTGVSLAAFLLGAFVFGHLGHFMGVRRRLWILVSTTYQICALIVAGILVSPSGPACTQIGGSADWLIIVLFANMSGCQVAMARQSGSQELPTAPMTSSYVDLMADKYLFVGFRHPKAGPRNRRLAYILAMVIGGFIGSTIHRFAGSYVVVIVTIALKCVVFSLVCGTRAEVRKAKA